MVIRLIFLFLFGLSATAHAQQIEPGDMTLRLSLEDLPYTPYEEELVLLKIHGIYKIPISLEKLEQSDLEGVDWMQLGIDNWYETTERGLKVVNFERTMALFPNRSGTIEIAPFTHHLELVTKTGKRFKRDVVSDPISLEVLPKPVIDDWWLPVRKIRVEDSWSNSPHELGPGEGALRIVRVDISGVKPSQVPPMPDLEVAGAMAFPHPEKRFEKLGWRGPRATVFWRWTIRPDEPPSAYLKPLRIPYFDSVTREHKEIIVAAQRISMSDEAIAEFEQETGKTVKRTETPQRGSSLARYAGISPLMALLIGLVGGVILLVPGVRMRSREEVRSLARRFLPDPDVQELKRAARQGDSGITRSAALRVMQAEDEEALQALADFDRARYGPAPTTPDCRRLASAALKSRKRKARLS